MRGFVSHLLFLLSISILASQPAFAQSIRGRFLPPYPPTPDTLTRYKKSRLYFTTTDILMLQNGLTDDSMRLTSAEYQQRYHHAPKRRSGIRGWFGCSKPVPNDSVSVPNLAHDLGAFPSSGLHQLYFSKQTKTSLVSRGDNFFAFSGYETSHQSSLVLPPVVLPVSLDTLRRVYTLLDSAMRHCRPDTLYKKWDSLVKAEVQGLPLGYPSKGSNGDFALVLAVDRPVVLFVLGRPADADLRKTNWLMQGQVLDQLLALFQSPTFSALTDSTGKAIPILSSTAVASCARVVRQLAQIDSLPTYYDSGFCREILLQEGVNEPAADATFRLARPNRRFRQLIIVFRLRRS